MARASAVGALLAVMLACGPEPEPTRETSRPQLGQNAAVVNDELISLEEVRRLCEHGGQSPREALALLVRERLLAQYAEARGYGALPSVQRGVQQARAQALLAREVEQPGSPTGVEEQRQRLDRLLATLRSKTAVHYDEAAIRQAFTEAAP